MIFVTSLYLQIQQGLENILTNLQAGHPLSENQKIFLQTHANEVKNLLPSGMAEVTSFIQSYGLPRGGIPRIQNQIYNLETSMDLEEVNLANLKTRRQQLMDELATVNQNIARTENSLERTYTSYNNRISIVESHENRKQAIQIVQNFLNSM